jgi:predicted nuclease with TOPRIM domain
MADLSIQLSDVQSSNQELTEAKVRLEMRAVDLEEQRDRAEDEAKELQITIENLKAEIKVHEHLPLTESTRRKTTHRNINSAKKTTRRMLTCQIYYQLT